MSLLSACKTFAIPFTVILLFARNGAAGADDSYDPHKVMLARAHYEKGMKLLQKDSRPDAEVEFQQSVRVFPEFADGYIQLGNLATLRKDYSAGLEHYIRARTALLNLQGMSRQQEVQRRRQLQESMDILRARIDQMRMSQRPAITGELSEAMTQLEKLQQEQTKILARDELAVPPEIHFLIGTARMNLEQFDQAIEDFHQALALRPAYGEVHNNLAVIYLYRKDYPQAWDHLHAAEKAGVRINPQFREELAAVAPESPAPAR
jgi:tetratricopeptide (TPR) repeat protein